MIEARTPGHSRERSRAVGASAMVLALALAGCASQGGKGPATSAMPNLPTVQIRPIAWPLPASAAGAPAATGGAGGTNGAGAPVKAATAQVTDPFAGQGVAAPDIPPTGNVAASSAPKAATAASTAAPAARHTVAAGETGWSVARRYGVSIQDLARANGLSESMTLRVGQTLVIPAGGTRSVASATTAPGVGSPTPTPPSASKPLPAERTEPVSAANSAAPRPEAPDLGKTRTAASGGGKLAMPANGAIVRPYAKGSNEGIDISAPAGTPISAAAAGTVAAVTRDTDGVPIVVVRHDDGLMTVYAGLDNLKVGKGDKVTRGQSIGGARNTGVVHFEVRKGFDSVDPEDYL